MIETGIPKLDEYLGGIPPGKSLIFSIEPGVEESNMGIHVLHHVLEKGLHGMYVASESSPKNLKKAFSEFGWDVKKYERLTVIDGYSSLIGSPSDEQYVVEEPHDIKSYEDALMMALENITGSGVIVFDSLSTMMDMCGERETLEGIATINDEIGGSQFAAVYNFIAWPYKEAIFYRIRRLFNAIVDVSVVEDVATRQRMHVRKVDWQDGAEGRGFDFKIFKPEGFRIYIPKISVVGPFQSGKTTFIKALATQFTPVERMGASVGLEYGLVDYRGYRADVFGIPGQERFLPLLGKLGASSMGILLLVDATRPHEFEFAKRILATFPGIPYVIVANKQDLPGALKEAEVRERFGLPDAVVVEASALRGEGVHEAFMKLVNIIVEGPHAR
ncbi:MAG: hypothetical protein DRN07_03345 [Thermoplasmata archaeon]|nr:MAG: hypothetical protein DRN07_03345 [Thermoplasmata archaeon]